MKPEWIGKVRVGRPTFYEKTGWSVEIMIKNTGMDFVNLELDELTKLRDHLTAVIDFTDTTKMHPEAQ